MYAVSGYTVYKYNKNETNTKTVGRQAGPSRTMDG